VILLLGNHDLHYFVEEYDIRENVSDIKPGYEKLQLCKDYGFKDQMQRVAV
jgi:hypothetical protein